MTPQTWLQILVFAPLLGATACIVLSPFLAQRLARVVSAVPLLALIPLATQLYPGPLPPKLLLEWAWLPGIPVSLSLGLSSLSLPFLFVGLLAVHLAVWQDKTEGLWLTSPCLLVLQSCLTLLFGAQDLIVFGAAVETFYLGVFFLARCESSTLSSGRNAVGFSLVAGALMLGAAVSLGAMHQAQFLTFSVRWSALRELSFPNVEFFGDLSPGRVIFWLLAVSTFLRAPLAPAHGWFRQLFENGSGPVRVLSIGCATPIAVFTWVQWILPILPEAYSDDSGVLALIAAIGLVYVSVLATLTTRLDRWLAYWLCALNSFAFLGLFVLSGETTGSAVVLALTAPLGLLGATCCVQRFDRLLATTEAHDIGSLGPVTPRMAWIFAALLATLAALPGTANFAPLLVLLTGLISSPPLLFCAALAWLSLLISVARISYPLFSGPSPHKGVRTFPDLSLWKSVVALILLLAICFLGIRPDFLRSRTEPALESNGKAPLKAKVEQLGGSHA